MRRAAVAVLLCLACARAFGDESSGPPRRWIAAVTGYRLNLGELGDTYTHAGIFGIGAGIQPGILGLAWTVSWSWAHKASDTLPDTWLSIWELEMAGRVRVPFRLGGVPSALFGQAGIALFRTGIPVGDDESREHFGPTAGGGFQFALGSVLVDLVGDYSLLGGPSGVKFMLFVGKGSR